MISSHVYVYIIQRPVGRPADIVAGRERIIYM